MCILMFHVMFKLVFFTRTDAMAGIDDLKSGRLTTPLPAKTIFLEDPLASS